MNSRIKLPIAAIFTAVLFSAGALGQKIDYQVEPGTNFAQYRTYRWQRAEKAIYPEKALDDMIVRVIEAEMAKKGFTRTEDDEADMIAVYQIAIMDDMEWSAGHSTIPFMGNPTGLGLQGGPVSGSNVIKKGSFILDFYDGKKKNQIWQAHATKTLADTTDLGTRTKNTEKAMAKIFKNYPPK